MRGRVHFGALILSATLLIVGCSDLPTAPQTDVADPQYGLLSDLLGVLDAGREVTVLRRSVPLTEDEFASAVIGRYGGVLRLPRAGLTVVVPYGALTTNTRITVMAPEGDLVGYHFEPHGLEFRLPVTISQDLLRTEGFGLGGLSAVYFDGELEPTVTALETLRLWILRALGIFSIRHFSGYVIATN